MRRKWYGIFAENGLGVYYDYNRLMHNSQYTRGERVKGFANQEEAEEFAVDGFVMLHGMDALLATVPNLDAMRLNYFYFKKSATQNPEDETEEE